MPSLVFAASVTVTKAREAKTWADSALLVHPRSPAGTMRTAVSSRFHMRPCEIPKRSDRWMTRSSKSLRSLARSSSLGLWRVQVAASFRPGEGLWGNTCGTTHLLTLLLQNHLENLHIVLQDLWHIHDLLSRVVTTVNMCTSIRAVACSKFADDLTSNNHDFFHEPQHWHIHDLLLNLRLDKQDPLRLARDEPHDACHGCEKREQAPCESMTTYDCLLDVRGSQSEPLARPLVLSLE